MSHTPIFSPVYSRGTSPCTPGIPISLAPSPRGMFLGSRMPRSQGRALYLSDGDTAGNPEHEPARRRLSLLTLGLRRCPGPGPAAGSLLPPASRLARSAALVGVPRRCRSGSGRQAPGSPAGADPGPQLRERADPREPGRHGRRRAFHVGICLRSCSRLCFAARAGPRGSDIHPTPRPPKLISRTCQFALVWKILKNLETFGNTAAPGSLPRCLARAVGRSRGCGVCLDPTSQPCSLAPASLVPGRRQSCRTPLGDPIAPDAVA